MTKPMEKSELTSYGRVLANSNSVKEYPKLRNQTNLLPCLQEPVTAFCPEPDEFCPHTHVEVWLDKWEVLEFLRICCEFLTGTKATISYVGILSVFELWCVWVFCLKINTNVHFYECIHSSVDRNCGLYSLIGWYLLPLFGGLQGNYIDAVINSD